MCEDASLTDHRCGQNFIGEKEGDLEFSMPHYDKTTQKNTISCSWTIEMQFGHKVALSIKELSLNVNDSLVITESYSELAGEESNNRRFHVLKPGSVIYSQSNKLRVEIIATKDSFAKFNAVFEDAECEETITEEQGEIRVPLFVHLSQAYNQCKWRLVAPAEKIVKLSFSQFYLAPGSCIFEGLSIKDGKSNDVLGDYCEENPPTGSLASSHNSIFIEFTKRPSFTNNLLIEAPKITMIYEFVDQCNSKIQGSFGTVSIPFTYDGLPLSQQACQWDITVPEGHHISFSFLKYTTGPKIPGQYQEVSIYDGIQSNRENRSRLLWSSTDSLLPPFRLITDSRSLRIVRKTIKNAVKSHGISFKALYQAELDMGIWNDECINMGNRRFYQCSNGHYIDCNWVCDGVTDCADGIDESSCPANNYEIVQESDDDDDDDATNTITMLLILAVTCSALAVFSLISMIDKVVRKKYRSASAEPKNDGHYRYYVDLKRPELPRYDKIVGSGLMAGTADATDQTIPAGIPAGKGDRNAETVGDACA